MRMRRRFLCRSGILRVQALQGVSKLKIYLDIVVLLNFVVDFLLLMGTNRLTGYPQRWGRMLLSAALGGIYGGVCLLPGMYFLGNTIWRTVFLLIMGCVAFGCNPGALRRCILFAVLCMALGGVASGLNRGGFWEIILSCVLLCLLCYVGFRGRAGICEHVKVSLRHMGKDMDLIALRDTGNMLCDPITGQSVLILSADTAGELLGLSREQLLHPVETMASGCLQGLRLLPYQTVGKSTEFLLALRLDWVKIGSWQGSCLAAFSPEKLDREGSYQALTGGIV